MASKTRGIFLDKRDSLLFKKLKEDYKKIGYDNIKKIEPILNGKSKISLRIIEWFITSFSKRKHITCQENDTLGKLSVYRSYKNNLNAYHGKHFSIFKRTRKINVLCNQDGNISIEPNLQNDDMHNINNINDNTNDSNDNNDNNDSNDNNDDNDNNDNDNNNNSVNDSENNSVNNSVNNSNDNDGNDEKCNGKCNDNKKRNNKQINNTFIILNTTIAQLNLFKWILEKKLLTYIEKYYSQICDELYEKQKKIKEYENDDEEISISSTVTGKNTETGEIEILINWK
jgi:hypothetical protein